MSSKAKCQATHRQRCRSPRPRRRLAQCPQQTLKRLECREHKYFGCINYNDDDYVFLISVCCFFNHFICRFHSNLVAAELQFNLIDAVFFASLFRIAPGWRAKEPGL